MTCQPKLSTRFFSSVVSIVFFSLLLLTKSEKWSRQEFRRAPAAFTWLIPANFDGNEHVMCRIWCAQKEENELPISLIPSFPFVFSKQGFEFPAEKKSTGEHLLLMILSSGLRNVRNNDGEESGSGIVFIVHESLLGPKSNKGTTIQLSNLCEGLSHS